MSIQAGETFVAIRPSVDVSAFRRDAENQIDSALSTVQPTVRVQVPEFQAPIDRFRAQGDQLRRELEGIFGGQVVGQAVRSTQGLDELSAALERNGEAALTARQRLLLTANASRELAETTEKTAESQTEATASAGRFGGGMGSLIGRVGLYGLAISAAFSAQRKLTEALEVSGNAATTTSGRFRNAGAALLSGDIVGAFGKLNNEAIQFNDEQLRGLRIDRDLQQALELTNGKLGARTVILKALALQSEQFVKSTQDAIAAANGLDAAAFGERSGPEGRGPGAIAKELSGVPRTDIVPIAEGLTQSLRTAIARARASGNTSRLLTQLENADKSVGDAITRTQRRTDLTRQQIQEGLEKLFTARAGIRGEIKSLNDELARGPDFELPARLSSAQLSAQLTERLDDNLSIDQQIEDFLSDLLAHTKTGTVRFQQIQQALVAAHNERVSVEQQIGTQAQAARDKADQAVLDQLSRGRTGVNQRLAIARQTEDPRDDVPAQQALIRRIEAEIDRVRSTVQDAKTKASELDRLDDELFQAGLDLKAARQRRDEALAAAGEERFSLRVSIAQSTGNTTALLRLFDDRIAGLRAAITKAQNEGKATLQLRDTLASVQRDRDQLEDDVAEKRIQIAELRGNKSAALTVIDQRIADTQKDIAAARRLRRSTVDLELELEQWKQKRKDILGETTDSGTTLADLFRQQVGIAGRAGIDLPAQPPGDLTQPIEDAVTRQLRARAATPAGPADRGTDRIVGSQDKLVGALGRLTDAVQRESSSRTGRAAPSAPVPIEGLRYQAMARFWQSRRARQLLEDTASA